MSLPRKVLNLAVIHWNANFTGISAIAIAEQLCLSHEDALTIVRELAKTGKGSINDNVTLHPVSITINDEVISEELDEVITAIFFPSKQALEDHFRASDLIHADIPEYKARLHKGYSQIHLFYFSVEVLRRYKTHLEMFSVDDTVSGGLIGPNRDYLNTLSEEDADQFWFSLDFGKRRLEDGNISVTVILNDLASLPSAEQRHWHSHEIVNPSFVNNDIDFARFFLRNFEGEWIDYDDPLEKTLEAIVSVNEHAGEKSIFRNTENPYLSYPLSNTFKDFCDSCSELYKLVGPDNIDSMAIKLLLMKYYGMNLDDFIHQETKRPLSPLQLLGLLANKIPAGFLIMHRIDEIRKFRVEANHKIVQPEYSTENYVDRFRGICSSLYAALTRLMQGISLMDNSMSKDEAFNHLERTISSLQMTTQSILPEVRDAIEGRTELPDGCPSRESLASLVFRQIREKLNEVNAAIVIAETSIWRDDAG
jgi:hypothetical protein